MSKMSIADASEHFGISKEAIHNRIRRGSLNSVIEDGVKFVILDSNAPVASKVHMKKPRQTRKVNTQSNDKYYKFLEEQNIKLQEKVEKLEGETRTLRDQKEDMLIQERIKIEEIYKQKDEQLKNILNVISSKFMLNAPLDENIEQNYEHQDEKEEELLEAEIEEEVNIVEDSPHSEIISLKKYLKRSNYSDKKKEKIKKRFKKAAKKDKRIFVIGSKYYMNTLKYDYNDLLL